MPPIWGLLLVPALCRADLEVDSLLAQLARPPPATTAFVEVRFSKLLDRPLIVKGQLGYLEGGVLTRTVNEPFRERTEIRGDSVDVQREGQPSRRFSLKRTPELRGMLGSFAAVLGDSRAALEQDFNLTLAGDARHWHLNLTPKSPQLGRYLHDLAIQGQGNEPRCIVVTQPNEYASVMLLGAAANASLPAPVSRAWLNGFCDSDGA